MEEYIVKSIRLFLRSELKSKSALGLPQYEVHQSLGLGLPQCWSTISPKVEVEELSLRLEE